MWTLQPGSQCTYGSFHVCIKHSRQNCDCTALYSTCYSLPILASRRLHQRWCVTYKALHRLCLFTFAQSRVWSPQFSNLSFCLNYASISSDGPATGVSVCYDFMTLAHNIHVCTLRQINWQKAAQRGSRVVTCEWHVHTATHWGRGSTCADAPDTQDSWSERPSPHTDSTQTTLHQPIHRQVHQLESPHSRLHRPLQHKELNKQKIPATVTCIPLQIQVCFSTECAFLSPCDLYA